MAQTVSSEIGERIHGIATTGQCQTLHIAALGTTECHDTFASEGVKRNWVNALLVHYDKTRLGISLASGLVANLAFQIDDGLNSLVNELTFGLNELVAFLGRLVKEARVNFTKLGQKCTNNLRFLVFQRNVAGENVSVSDTLWHIGVTAAVIHN